MNANVYICIYVRLDGFANGKTKFLMDKVYLIEFMVLLTQV